MARTQKDTTQAAPAPAGAQPTMQDVEAIGTAAQTAAEQEARQSGDATAAGDAAAAAAQQEAQSRGIELPQHVIDQIARATAAATVHELAQQGALQAAPEPEPDEDEDEGETPAEAVADEPPRKVTMAEKFLKGYEK